MTNSEVQYGVLLACCAVVETGIAFCILQELQPQKDIGGMPITSEFNCPLLLLTSNVYAIPTTSIISPVSVIHMCDYTCSFAFESVSRSVERQTVTSNKLTYRHNLDNNLYCLNIFCISHC